MFWTRCDRSTNRSTLQLPHRLPAVSQNPWSRVRWSRPDWLPRTSSKRQRHQPRRRRLPVPRSGQQPQGPAQVPVLVLVLVQVQVSLPPRCCSTCRRLNQESRSQLPLVVQLPAQGRYWCAVAPDLAGDEECFSCDIPQSRLSWANRARASAGTER